MITLILRTLVVSALVTVAAFIFERALRSMQVGARHAWTFALLLSTTLPFIPRLLPTTSASVISAVPAINIPTVTFVTSPAANPVNWTLVAWLVLSAIALAVYVIACVRLRMVSRAWRRTTVLHENVFLSNLFGPAVFGFIRPRIVLPEWVLTTSSEEQKLIVMHEREHIERRDHLLLLLALVATAWMPWNPFVWLQARRLRFALEVDCDQRVLAAAPDAVRYASLLVDVGSRQSGFLFAAALAEHRHGLERRIAMLAESVIRNRWKAAALAVAGMMVTIVSCESRLPEEPQQPRPAAENMRVGQAVSEKVLNDQAVLVTPNVEELMAKYYPSELREKRIGGIVRAEVKISATGEVLTVKLVGTSGNTAIDEAGVNVVKLLKYKPATGADGKPVASSSAIYLAFQPQLGLLRQEGEPPASYPRENQLESKMRVEGTALVPTLDKVRTASGNPEQEYLLKQSYERMTERMREPTFTPYTDKPELLNREEIAAKVRNVSNIFMNGEAVAKPIVWILVGPGGGAEEVRVASTSGDKPLDEAALEIARQMRFRPAKDHGRVVSVWIQLPMVFKVD